MAFEGVGTLASKELGTMAFEEIGTMAFGDDTMVFVGFGTMAFWGFGTMAFEGAGAMALLLTGLTISVCLGLLAFTVSTELVDDIRSILFREGLLPSGCLCDRYFSLAAAISASGFWPKAVNTEYGTFRYNVRKWFRT